MIYIIILGFFLVFFIEYQLQKWVDFIRMKYDKSYNWSKKNIITNIITEQLDKNPIYTKRSFLFILFTYMMNF